MRAARVPIDGGEEKTNRVFPLFHLLPLLHITDSLTGSSPRVSLEAPSMAILFAAGDAKFCPLFRDKGRVFESQLEYTYSLPKNARWKDKSKGFREYYQKDLNPTSSLLNLTFSKPVRQRPRLRAAYLTSCAGNCFAFREREDARGDGYEREADPAVSFFSPFRPKQGAEFFLA